MQRILHIAPFHCKVYSMVLTCLSTDLKRRSTVFRVKTACLTGRDVFLITTLDRVSNSGSTAHYSNQSDQQKYTPSVTCHACLVDHDTLSLHFYKGAWLHSVCTLTQPRFFFLSRFVYKPYFPQRLCPTVPPK